MRRHEVLLEWRRRRKPTTHPLQQLVVVGSCSSGWVVGVGYRRSKTGGVGVATKTGATSNSL